MFYLSARLHNEDRVADFAKAVSIAMTQSFDDEQVGLFGASDATSETFATEGFVGDTTNGGSCNVRRITTVPHCNGTHTESVAHIVDSAHPVSVIVGHRPFVAVLLTVDSTQLVDSGEFYEGSCDSDLVLTAKATQKALERYKEATFDAMIVRTNPNDRAKCTARYGDDHLAPFFTTEAMRFIAALPIKHLLVDLPSVDRIIDEGRLANHREFWKVGPGKKSLSPDSRVDRTITEFIFVPSPIEDGLYALDLQVPDWQTDAVPSRPILIPFERAS